MGHGCVGVEEKERRNCFSSNTLQLYSQNAKLRALGVSPPVFYRRADAAPLA